MTWLTDFLCDSVTITPRGTLSGDGTYTYDGTAVATTARVVEKSGITMDTDGRDFKYRYEIYFRPTETIAEGDHVTFDSKTLEVVDVYAGDFIDGTASHKKVRCG